MTGWSDLRDALKRCRNEDLAVHLWWRDDDATAETAALDRLERLSEKLGVMVNLAVIPEAASRNLAKRVIAADHFAVLVHGWAHHNHAPADMKKSEFGTLRDGVETELTQGLQRLRALFAGKALPVFVPPWNRIHLTYHAALRSAGYCALSTFAPRPQRFTASGLFCINTHVDPIDWRGSRDLVTPEMIIGQTVARLEARLQRREDPDEPLGYLSHHLVHSEKIWDFSAKFLSEMMAGGACALPLPQLLETPT